METLRRLTSAFLSRGVPSAGWYSILTGFALLVTALALVSASQFDGAAGVVAVIFFLAGAWQLERGIRAEYIRRPRPEDDDT